MADSSFGFLSQKTGPLPLWAWMAGGIGIWYFVLRKSGGTTSPAATQLQTGYGTDPSGNTGYIDPQTGYVYGSAEDIAALQQQGLVAANQTGSSGSTTANQYTDNSSWARAAVNYLVGIGIDPTEASEAVQQYLSGQALTSQQQADVNLAIQGIGAPPQIPGPVGTPPVGVNPPPPGGAVTVQVPDGSGGWMTVSFPSQSALNSFYSALGVTGGSYPNGLTASQINSAISAAGGTVVSGGGTPPGPVGPPVPPLPVVPPPVGGGGTGSGSGSGGGSWQYPAPTGLKASSISSTGYSISWNAVKGPNGQSPSTYTVATYQTNGKQVDQFQSGSLSTKEYGAGGKGLTPGYTYRTNVWANGGPKAPPHASIVVTLKPKGK